MSLEGKTLAEVSGIKVNGENKWITLIQNAKNQVSNCRNTNFFWKWLLDGTINRSSKQVTIPNEKGFDPSLFDCMDKALTATLGKTTITTFYYAIQERYHVPESEFPQKPSQVVSGLREILGEIGFRVLERPLISQIKQTFEIIESVHDLQKVIELAKRNYLQASF